jgi:hypothetical protein
MYPPKFFLRSYSGKIPEQKNIMKNVTTDVRASLFYGDETLAQVFHNGGSHSNGSEGFTGPPKSVMPPYWQSISEKFF